MNESHYLPANDIGPETLAAISLAAESRGNIPGVQSQSYRFTLLERQLQSAGLLLVQMLNERALTLPGNKYGWRLPVTANRGQDVILTRQGDIVILQTGFQLPSLVGALTGIAALGVGLIASTFVGGRPATIGLFLFALQGLAFSLCISAFATGTGFLAGYVTWRLMSLRHRQNPIMPVTLGPDSEKHRSDLGPQQINTILELTRQRMRDLGVSLPASLAEAN